MRKFGLIGHPLGHSLSQKLFADRYPQWDYHLYERDSVTDIASWATTEGIDGFNVTIPFKETIMEYLDEVESTARAIGAVNCVKVVRTPHHKPKLIGYNTDAPAFEETLALQLNGIAAQQALILGNGGAAKAVAHGLQHLNINHRFLTHSDIDRLKIHGGDLSSYDIIVNATPVGMFPDRAVSPLNIDNGRLQLPTGQWLCYDLIYNPDQTLLLQQAAAKGAKTCNGMAMLKRQAALSWEIWGCGDVDLLSC